MMDQNSSEYWQKKTAVDRDGEKIGSVHSVYIDAATGDLEWLVVNTGLLRRNVVVPAADAKRLDEETVQVPFTAAQIKDAPTLDPLGEISRTDEASLYAHYGMAVGEQDAPSVREDEVTGFSKAPEPGGEAEAA